MIHASTLLNKLFEAGWNECEIEEACSETSDLFAQLHEVKMGNAKIVTNEDWEEFITFRSRSQYSREDGRRFR